ncbi:MAG: class I SAM-dependent RNA methyltransferase [Clostridia bacterium]|nr:class I SAM-dependent RNA methyltransferase [Clostridia bacterium]
MGKYQLIATSSFGLESVVAQEVRDLGYEEVRVENGKITFKAGLEAICRANLWLRTADRIRLVVGEFEAKTFDELFEKTKALPWADLIPKDANFPVEGKSIKSTLFSVPDCQAIVKKAVVESMKKEHHCQWFEEKGPMHKIEVALLKDKATLTMDTSGPGLHKRGYRESGVIAPLRETLAAAMILLARWNPDTTLIDPFCGSGTIPIEAALMGKNIAPGMNRNFVAETWPLIPKKLWQDARRECWDLADFSRPVNITGTDIDYRAVRMARGNAANADLDQDIHFQQQPLSTLSSKRKYGKVICNPPYGERLEEETEELYREMGKILPKLDTWSHYILTSDQNFEKLYGAKATKKRKLYNGRIRVDYYQYYGPSPPRNSS